MGVQEFYDRLAPYYHLIYDDWDAAMERQARGLRELIETTSQRKVSTVLDVACGIGTQAIGLARLGYAVTALDLSPVSVERAKREAAARNLSIDFSVCDMTRAFDHLERSFDMVLACDNSVPHLLSDEQILTAFRQMWRCTTPGGCCLVGVRDYDALDRSARRLVPYDIHVEENRCTIAFQAWEPKGDRYEVAFFVIEDTGSAEPITRVMRTEYYAVGIPRLLELMEQAGFVQAQRFDDRMFQPVLCAQRPSAASS